MRILYWDNADDDRANLSKALREDDEHHVEATGSTDEFRRLLEQRDDWDLIVVDLLSDDEEVEKGDASLRLAETTGYRLAKEVRKRLPTVLIVLVTRYSRVVIEAGFEKLGAPAFLDSKNGGFSWLRMRILQLYDLVKERDLLLRTKTTLESRVEKQGTTQAASAVVGLITFLLVLFGALILPPEAAGGRMAKALLVFGLAICGASGAVISDTVWPQGRRMGVVLSVGAAAGASLGLSYLLPIHQAAGETRFPHGSVIFVGSLVAFFLGVAFEPAMLRIREIGLDYLGSVRSSAKTPARDPRSETSLPTNLP